MAITGGGSREAWAAAEAWEGPACHGVGDKGRMGSVGGVGGESGEKKADVWVLLLVVGME
jgi:hypothetical protein